MSLVARVVHREHGRGRLRRTARSANVVRRYTGTSAVCQSWAWSSTGPGHEARQRGQRREREEGEAAGVVGIVHGVLAVDARPVEVIEVLDEVHLRARGSWPAARKTRASSVRAAHRHQERRPDRLEVRLDVAHRAVEREDGQHVEPGGLLELREPADGLGETAGAGVGKVFRRDVDDGHRLAARRRQRRAGVPARSRLVDGRHPASLMPWADRPRTIRRGSPERSAPARSSGPCAGR